MERGFVAGFIGRIRKMVSAAGGLNYLPPGGRAGGSPAVAPIDRHIDSPPKPDSRAAFLESGRRYSAVFGSDKRDMRTIIVVFILAFRASGHSLPRPC